MKPQGDIIRSNAYPAGVALLAGEVVKAVSGVLQIAAAGDKALGLTQMQGSSGSVIAVSDGLDQEYNILPSAASPAAVIGQYANLSNSATSSGEPAEAIRKLDVTSFNASSGTVIVRNVLADGSVVVKFV